MNPNSIIGNHIFIIEDDIFMQYVLKRIFAGACLATIFSNGQAALTALESGVIPDLIITDLNVPLLNGMQLLSKVKASAEFSHVPVMMMSADDSREMIMKSVAAGASDYLTKPFEPKELINRATHIISTTSHQLALMHA